MNSIYNDNIYKELSQKVSPNNMPGVVNIINQLNQDHEKELMLIKKIPNMGLFERDILVYQGVTYYTPDHYNVYTYDDKLVAIINKDTNSLQFKNTEYYQNHITNSSIINSINKNKIVYINK